MLLPRPSKPATAPCAVSDWPPVPEYWLVPMDSLATCPVKSTEMQVFTETIREFCATMAGLFTQLPRWNSTATLSSSQS